MLTGRGAAYGGTGTDTLAIDFALEPAAVWFSGGYGWANSAGADILYQSQFESFKISGTAYNDSIPARRLTTACTAARVMTP